MKYGLKFYLIGWDGNLRSVYAGNRYSMNLPKSLPAVDKVKICHSGYHICNSSRSLKFWCPQYDEVSWGRKAVIALVKVICTF